MIDWTLELIFRRDIVKMDVTPSQGINRVHYEEGEIIYRQGGLARNFYIIIDGEVGVYRQENGEERSVATLRAGEFFGEMSLLQGVRHTASVRALTPVDLLAMNGADFSALAASSRGFGELLADVMRQRHHRRVPGRTRRRKWTDGSHFWETGVVYGLSGVETTARARIRACAFAGNDPLEIGDENSCHQLRGSSTLKFQVIEAGRE